MIMTLKYLLCVLYLLAVPAAIKSGDSDFARYYLYALGAVVAVHIVEVFVFYARLTRYKGSVLVSVLLTIAFGFLHWLPLSKEAGVRNGDGEV